ncbi:6,7-dimethyl-8-ribityllumazine synthase [Lampropedia puyangensis]|uniref:6,7-dimethyl-8-ribityllumazine synthase n=1 Tax=Lampropedia puyangensis TaxID=1330072 RepID=A0A4S8F5W4_9BURK|nr:6,7-dimethyl-8-ribityllumazine synthase [Lampropedia puyangensis]
MNQSPISLLPQLACRDGAVLSDQGPRVAMVAAAWHADIVQRATTAFAQRFAQLQPLSQIQSMEVPGVFEIPLQAKLLAQSGEYDAIVAFGFVVDGGIYRHDFVSAAVIDGLMRVQLDTSVPIFSVVLTPHHFHANEAHQQFFEAHFIQKGEEAANACGSILQTWEPAAVGLASKPQVAVASAQNTAAEGHASTDAPLAVWARRSQHAVE